VAAARAAVAAALLIIIVVGSVGVVCSLRSTGTGRQREVEGDFSDFHCCGYRWEKKRKKLPPGPFHPHVFTCSNTTV